MPPTHGNKQMLNILPMQAALLAGLLAGALLVPAAEAQQGSLEPWYSMTMSY
jgi:hypothetical protein